MNPVYRTSEHSSRAQHVSNAPLYMDHAATTAPRREVLEVMWPWLTAEFGNASSHHERGTRAARALDDARERIAAILGGRPGEIIFTSGGTEADNLAVKGIALARRERKPERARVLTSAIEHDAVLESARDLARFSGFTAQEIPVTSIGLVTPEAFRAALSILAAPDDAATSGSSPHPDFSTESVAVASIMLANNEVGTLQDITALAEVAEEFEVPLHTDAVQAAGTLPLNVTGLGVSALSLAGHKIGTPPGIGLLWVKRGTPLRPLMSGGGHERGRRSGTSTVAAAVGLARALELAERERTEHTARLSALRDRLITGILREVPGAVLTGPSPSSLTGLKSTKDHLELELTVLSAPQTHHGARLAGNASFCFPGVNGETVLIELERHGVLVSSGSACAAGSTEPSHVLTAMGFDAATASTAVRYSLGGEHTAQDVDRAVAVTTQVVKQLMTG